MSQDLGFLKAVKETPLSVGSKGSMDAFSVARVKQDGTMMAKFRYSEIPAF